MITHTSDSNFEILQEPSHEAHLLKLLDKMYKYEMDPTRTIGAAEQTRDAGQTDGWCLVPWCPSYPQLSRFQQQKVK